MSATVDTREVDAFLKKAVFSAAEMLIMEKPIGLSILNVQRQLVRVVTGNLQGSITTQIMVSTPRLVSDHIGPNTPYAAAVEFGRPDMPNYPIQPYVRPSANVRTAERVAQVALKKMVKRKHG